MKTMMYDVSQVVSYSGMMKGKGILLRYNCPSLHITFNIILDPCWTILVSNPCHSTRYKYRDY